MARQASFRGRSSFLTCVDLSHTGHAYSVVEQQSLRAVVLMVVGLAPRFAFYPRSLPEIQGWGYAQGACYTM